MVESALGGMLSTWLIRKRRRKQLLVLSFHNVVPDGAPPMGDRLLHMRLSVFEAMIDRFLEVCKPVSLSDDSFEVNQPRFAVTFDDAYRGALAHALPALASRGVPATVFVPTSLIGDRAFWWDELADPDSGLDPRLRQFALDEWRGDDLSIKSWATRERVKRWSVGSDWRSSTESELRDALKNPGVQLAPHTATHRALDLLEHAELVEEMRSPLDWFEKRHLPFVMSLTYPYGRWSRRAAETAADSGYESAWLVGGGWCSTTATNRMAQPRLNINWGTSVAGVMLRAANLIRA